MSYPAFLPRCSRALLPQAVFPCTLRILPTCVFNKKDPIVLGVDIVEGVAKVGTPVAAQTEAGLVELGRIAGMEINHKVGLRDGMACVGVGGVWHGTGHAGAACVGPRA